MKPTKRPTHISISLCQPETAAGQEALAKHLAMLHAETVIQKIRALPCSPVQKLALLDAVIDTAKKQKL